MTHAEVLSEDREALPRGIAFNDNALEKAGSASIDGESLGLEHELEHEMHKRKADVEQSDLRERDAVHLHVRNGIMRTSVYRTSMGYSQEASLSRVLGHNTRSALRA